MTKCKIFIFIFSLMFFCGNVHSDEDVEREAALKQFDNDVDGGNALVNTVPPKTQNQLFEESVPPPFFDDDPWYPEDPMEDEFMYRNLRED
ncbi:MAG: hypothetical protein P9L88_01155 [Candidatus Tantalella remota]|nr:hypothetical protein [Candidatus Tantalella remota]